MAVPIDIIRELKNRFAGPCECPRHGVVLNGEPLPTCFVSKNDLKAIILPEAIPKAGTYIVTLTCEGQMLPESHRPIP